jgi:hypothetical protein
MNFEAGMRPQEGFEFDYMGHEEMFSKARKIQYVAQL